MPFRRYAQFYRWQFFFSTLKIFKGDPANILFRRTLCGHVTESRTALRFRNSLKAGQNSSFWIPLGFFVIAFDFFFHFIPFKNLRHSNLSIWWDGFDLNKKDSRTFPSRYSRIASCEFDIFPHLKDKLTSVPLTGVLTDRLRDATRPLAELIIVFIGFVLTRSVCAQFLYTLSQFL